MADAKKNFKSSILEESRKLVVSDGEKGTRDYSSIEFGTRVTEWTDGSREPSRKEVAIITKMKNTFVTGAGYVDVPITVEVPQSLIRKLMERK